MNTGLLELAAFYFDSIECLSKGTVAIRPLMGREESDGFFEEFELDLYQVYNYSKVDSLEEIWIEAGKPLKILMQPCSYVADWLYRHPEVEIWFYERKWNYYFSGEKIHYVDPSCRLIPMAEVYDDLGDDDLPF